MAAIDSRRLRPSELCRLLNSTPLGEVIGERQLHRHRTRAGLRITSTDDPRNIDLLRYVAWLVVERHTPRPEPEGLTGYDAHRERAAQRNRELSMSGRDIGEMPAVVNAERKQVAERNFRYFCEQYLPQTFHLRWSPDHLKVVRKIEQAVLEGGLFAMAMPRGSGKTSLCETACLWALLYGHREFVALIGSDEEHASKMLESIKIELETNELLLEDFPEVVFPIHALEGIHQRAGGQLYQGRQTHIGWTAREIVLPTIPDSKASGSIICVAGITGRIRGMKHKRVDGSSVRPSLVIIDDPQTDESARSPSQCATRERILAGAILGLAGPGRKIAGLMTLTVVRPDDLADRILNRDKHPQWQGERTKMVYAFPKNEALWAKYADLWREGMRADRGIVDATVFYRANRVAMDEGASVAWPERHHPDELSAIQHAMNLKLDRGETAFWAEYQNEPLPEENAAQDRLTADQVAEKITGRPRGEVPLAATRVTAFIDVHDQLLYWCACAWQEDFTGYVIDYGTFPEQHRAYFTLRDAQHTLAAMFRGAGREGAVHAGLERLAANLLARQWKRTDGQTLSIERLLIDSGYLPGACSAVAVKLGPAVQPSKGMGLKAGNKPMASYTRRPGERHGYNWYMPNVSRSSEFRHVAFDANFWKTFVHTRLATTAGDRGSLSLFGRQSEHHRLFAEHVAEAEVYVVTEGHGRIVHEWRAKPSHPDNHWFDCLVGCAVAASMLGVTTGAEPPRLSGREKPLTTADLRRK